jgi:hypothetical protein
MRSSLPQQGADLRARYRALLEDAWGRAETPGPAAAEQRPPTTATAERPGLRGRLVARLSTAHQ